MVYLHFITCLRYTILVWNPRGLFPTVSQERGGPDWMGSFFFTVHMGHLWPLHRIWSQKSDDSDWRGALFHSVLMPTVDPVCNCKPEKGSPKQKGVFISQRTTPLPSLKSRPRLERSLYAHKSTAASVPTVIQTWGGSDWERNLHFMAHTSLPSPLSLTVSQKRGGPHWWGSLFHNAHRLSVAPVPPPPPPTHPPSTKPEKQWLPHERGLYFTVHTSPLGPLSSIVSQKKADANGRGVLISRCTQAHCGRYPRS